MSLTLPCEFSVKEILPALRSIIAEKLVTEKGMPIYRAANAMGLTPAAVANYVNKRRGTGIRGLIEKDERLMSMVNDLVDRLASNKVDNLSTYYCILCSEGKRALKKSGMEVLPCMYENYALIK
ncbi:MAG: transcriptional regulator [Candidatus Aramenus sp.]|jgi:predicted transcriptional regulator|nr:transcriptional regulator [Candidatus Aramenus sp.]